MVKTTYPSQWRYINKWSVIAYGLMFFIPLHMTLFQGHLSWKRGKVPRLQYNDAKYLKFINARGGRDSLLQKPALEFYPDQDNRMHFKNIKKFLRKHRTI